MRAILLLLAGTIALGMQPAYSAPVESVNEGAPVKVEEAAAGKAKTAVASEQSEKKEIELQELTLNDIQDVGILLRHVKQQAINIYEEAARTKIGLNSSPDIPEIHTIPLPPHAAKTELLPPRTEYLVFFLATMEPIVRQLNKEISDVEAGTDRLVLPPSVDKYLEPMWLKWKTDVKCMNTHLDELVPLFDDAAHNNAKIQTLAVELFNDAHKLEVLRRDVFKVVQYMEKKAPDEKIMMPPG